MPKIKLLFLSVFLPIANVFCLTGLKYTHLETNASIHVIEIDPLEYEIKPIKALDNGIGRESVLSINNRYQAVASINGGFFSIGGTFDGKAEGALKINDWYALPNKPRACIGWSTSNQNPMIDRLLADTTADYKSKKINLSGLNRVRKEGEIILFTPCFHRTTLTNPDGEEIVIIDGVIRSIEKKGSTKIPENGFVLSIQKKHPLFNTFEIGMPLEVVIQTQPLLEINSPNQWDFLDYIVGGTPLLLYKNTKVTDFEFEQTIPTFLSNRHARTAIGILPNGNWIFVVVDKKTIFDGMTIPELCELMEKLGCTDAINLDGGGSSTMMFEGLIKNSPRGDEDEGFGKTTLRRVSDAIIVIPKKQSIGIS